MSNFIVGYNIVYNHASVKGFWSSIDAEKALTLLMLSAENKMMVVRVNNVIEVKITYDIVSGMFQFRDTCHYMDMSSDMLYGLAKIGDITIEDKS